MIHIATQTHTELSTHTVGWLDGCALGEDIFGWSVFGGELLSSAGARTEYAAAKTGVNDAASCDRVGAIESREGNPMKGLTPP